MDGGEGSGEAMNIPYAFGVVYGRAGFQKKVHGWFYMKNTLWDPFVCPYGEDT